MDMSNYRGLKQLKEQGYTTLGKRRLQELIEAKFIKGAVMVGNAWAVPLTDENIEAMKPLKSGESRKDNKPKKAKKRA